MSYIKVFLFLVTISYSSVFLSQTTNKKGVVFKNSSNLRTCEDGNKNAIKDAKNKIFKSYSYGLIVRTKDEWEFSKFYQKYMKSKYGILVKDGGCMVSAETKCYTKKMDQLIKKEFGSNIFERTNKEARKLFNK